MARIDGQSGGQGARVNGYACLFSTRAELSLAPATSSPLIETPPLFPPLHRVTRELGPGLGSVNPFRKHYQSVFDFSRQYRRGLPDEPENPSNSSNHSNYLSFALPSLERGSPSFVHTRNRRLAINLISLVPYPGSWHYVPIVRHVLFIPSST